MPTVHASASARIAAPAARAYAVLADYREGHPSILPRPPFGDLVVLDGGQGAGTRLRFEMTVGGRTRTSEAVVTEPEPGRVLVETIPDSGLVTTFTVDPDGDAACRVRIETTYRRAGVVGWIEARVAPRLLAPVYRDELRNLARVCAGHAAAA